MLLLLQKAPDKMQKQILKLLLDLYFHSFIVFHLILTLLTDRQMEIKKKGFKQMQNASSYLSPSLHGQTFPPALKSEAVASVPQS